MRLHPAKISLNKTFGNDGSIFVADPLSGHNLGRKTNRII
jgi:hypothetical protein